MKLPHTFDPVQRSSGARGASLQPGIGIQPARAAIGTHRIGPPPPPPALGPGNCACTPPQRNARLNIYRPVMPHGCNPGYAPQCDTQGGCNCVPAGQQGSLHGTPGAAINMSPVRDLMGALNFT